MGVHAFGEDIFRQKMSRFSRLLRHQTMPAARKAAESAKMLMARWQFTQPRYVLG
jgi:hypothetical protein